MKGAGTPGTQVTEEQAAYFQRLVEDAQRSFDSAVRTGRGMNAKELAAVSGCVVLSACAPDAFRSDNPYEAFLNRVQTACYYEPISSTTIGNLLQAGGSTNASYFLDETSRLYNGRITPQNWTLAITSQLQANPTDRGITCLLNEYQKEKGRQQ